MKTTALVAAALVLAAPSLRAQDRLTPETLWGLARVSGTGLSADGKTLYASVKHVDWRTEKSTTDQYRIDVATGAKTPLKPSKAVTQRDGASWYALEGDDLYRSTDEGRTWTRWCGGLDGADALRVSPDGRYVAFSKEVPIQKVLGPDRWSDLPKTTAQVYDDLNYRHWDAWEDGKFSHLFLIDRQGRPGAIDLLDGQAFDAPQKPFGDEGDFQWAPDNSGLLYVCKKKTGKAYATSTNTDLYLYRLATGATENWTEGMMGYDVAPQFSPDGKRVAWLSMARDGFEADKQRLMVADVVRDKYAKPRDLSASFDETVGSFVWGTDSRTLYLAVPHRGTEQLFDVAVPAELWTRRKDTVRQLTDGPFDVAGIVGQSGNELVVSRTDMNHAAELYAVNPDNGAMRQLTNENAAVYARLKPSQTTLRMVKTSDGKQMGVWVVYPPDFDATKKYPTLLYCQGGPQSALTQFYSFRWNFALMAAQGYIVVAPNRRGMPGWGTAWNEQISGDWGGQPMRDYLAAIDDVSKEPYVDRARRGCVGASYGGYSVYMLAGLHEGRFKTFIAHDGLFDLKSWYGTTEELWFANWDIGGPYWGTKPSKSYTQFNPSNFVDKWTAPILVVQGGTDYRVPIEQGLEAFQAAQLRGLKSRLLYFPNENHWVLHPQNGIAWQRTFFGWLKETL